MTEKKDQKKYYRIIELFMLERIFKIIEVNHQPNSAKSTTKPCS